MASARGHRMQGTEHDITFFLALGWFLIPDSCFLIPDSWFLWFLIPDSWFLIPDSWFLIPDSWFLIKTEIITKDRNYNKTWMENHIVLHCIALPRRNARPWRNARPFLVLSNSETITVCSEDGAGWHGERPRTPYARMSIWHRVFS